MSANHLLLPRLRLTAAERRPERFLLILALAAAASADAAQVRVFVGSSPVVFASVQPSRSRGRVLIPLREVAERLGWSISRGPLGRGLSLAQGPTRIHLPLTGGSATRNGIPIARFSPQVSKGKVLVPLSFFTEGLKATTAYNARRGTVQIFPTGGQKSKPDSRLHK